MEEVLVTAAIFVVPTTLLVIGLSVAGRKVAPAPLFWSGFAFLVYVLLLKGSGVFQIATGLEWVSFVWARKILSLSGTVAMLYLLPRVSNRAVGLTWTQTEGSLRPVIFVGATTLFAATATTFLLRYDPNTSLGNILFQATLPGFDEELFMRGLLLCLCHQAFGKGLKVWGVETGWGFWLVVTIFGCLHGVGVGDHGVQISLGAMISTGFTGFVLTWMRERTGSLVAPIVFHNVFNGAQALV